MKQVSTEQRTASAEHCLLCCVQFAICIPGAATSGVGVGASAGGRVIDFTFQFFGSAKYARTEAARWRCFFYIFILCATKASELSHAGTDRLAFCRVCPVESQSTKCSPSLCGHGSNGAWCCLKSANVTRKVNMTDMAARRWFC